MLTLKIIHRWNSRRCQCCVGIDCQSILLTLALLPPQQRGCCTSFSYTIHLITLSLSIASIVIIFFFLLYSFLNLSVPIKTTLSQKNLSTWSGQSKKCLLRQKKMRYAIMISWPKWPTLDVRAGASIKSARARQKSNHIPFYFFKKNKTISICLKDQLVAFHTKSMAKNISSLLMPTILRSGRRIRPSLLFKSFNVSGKGVILKKPAML